MLPCLNFYLDAFPTRLVFVLLQQQGNEEEEGKEAMSKGAEKGT